MNLSKFISEKIKELRTSLGISQTALANALGKTANTISRWETGEYKPSIEELEKLSRVFNVSILAFFPNEEAPKDEETKALLRATSGLPKEDIEELRRYAEFRRARTLNSLSKKGSSAGRKRKKDEN